MAQELAELLAAEKVDEFNEQRGERSRPDLFAVDLAGKNLSGADLSGANLEKADLTEADLTEANLMKALLAGIDGTGAMLVDVLGLRARFKGAFIDAANLSGSDFTEADFADAVLEGSTGVGVRMTRARLRACDAASVNWAGADLSEAKLHKANFTNADLHNADLTETTGAEADFSGARLDGIVGVDMRFPGAVLVGASLCAARIPGANLAGADLTGADLSRADLSRVNLAGANLTGANLTGAVLADACLDDAVLTDANLEDVDMTGLDPTSLGLDAETIEGLSGFGVAFNPDAALHVAKPSVARNGDLVAIVWENPDGDELTSVRFAVVRGTKVHSGVVPIAGDMVLDRQVVHYGEGFLLVVTRERPDGPAVVTIPLSPDGQIGPSMSAPLGYDPGVKPVLHSDGTTVRMWGLARRGPTLVVHELGETGLRPVNSERVATARGFLGGQPVLACKGGVLIPVGPKGAAAPRRSPDGFGGRWGLAAPAGEDLVAVWVLRAVGDTPGGIRHALIARRGAPRADVLTLISGVVGVAARPIDDEQVQLVWVEAGEDGLDPTTVHRATLPEGVGPVAVPVELDDVVEVHLTNDLLCLVRATGGAWFGTVQGKRLGLLEP